jgi:hypothetical protein
VKSPLLQIKAINKAYTPIKSNNWDNNPTLEANYQKLEDLRFDGNVRQRLNIPCDFSNLVSDVPYLQLKNNESKKFLGYDILTKDNLIDIIYLNTAYNENIDSPEPSETNEISVKKEQLVLVQNEVNDSKKQSRFIKSVEKNESFKEKNEIQENPTPNTQHPTPNTYKYLSPNDLLAEVQTGEKVIPSDKKTISKPRIKVDANSLLTTVEKELDNTYRETTLDKINRNSPFKKW